jgi:hypothetical protein
MVSLLHLADITEEGVAFQSPVDGKQMLLTPEHSMGIQNKLGTTQALLACLHHGVCVCVCVCIHVCVCVCVCVCACVSRGSYGGWHSDRNAIINRC